jgi:hypothetical protein
MIAALTVCASQAAADTTDARCDIYPAGADHTDKMIPCTFSQRQGYVTISRGDGVMHELSPVGDTPGNFEDQDGRTVYRQSGLGAQGLISGEQLTINFLKNVVNATNREADARLDGDLWTVTIDSGDEYEVPLAAIEGG